MMEMYRKMVSSPVNDGNVQEDGEAVDESCDERDNARLSANLAVDYLLHLFRRNTAQVGHVLYNLHVNRTAFRLPPK